MRLNLGCGRDIRDGYENVDAFVDDPRIVAVDLSKTPWPWENTSVDEVLMLDFLEHFPYRQTPDIIGEVWRILKAGALVEIQVPSFEECAMSILRLPGMLCNSCGFEFKNAHVQICPSCKSSMIEIGDAAMRRLYGGQNFEGNFHYTSFTKGSLERILTRFGFVDIESLESQHQRLNWNYKVRAKKSNVIRDVWGDEP